MNILFVCTVNQLRSPTAESLFSNHSGLNVKSAGTDPDCPCPLSSEFVSWADWIFVMENHHREKIRKKYKKRPGDRQIINLNIPDEYERDQPELITLLEEMVRPRLERILAYKS